MVHHAVRAIVKTAGRNRSNTEEAIFKRKVGEGHMHWKYCKRIPTRVTELRIVMRDSEKRVNEKCRQEAGQAELGRFYRTIMNIRRRMPNH